MDMECCKSAAEYIDKLRQEFIDMNKADHEMDLLVEKVNGLKRDIVGYHGREILELVQNADDAFQKLKEKNGECGLFGALEVEITYKGDLFTISNNGEPFDKAGIKAVVQGNNSSKTSGKFIGNKGTGFRSVLNWARAVRLYSGPFAVGFSKEYADKQFDLVKDCPQIAKQLKGHPDLYFPMLTVPYNLEDKQDDNRTTIEIDIDPEKIKDEFSVARQLNDFDLRVLLFLPNLSKLTISTDDTDIEYERTLNGDVAVLTKKVSGEITVQEKFWLFRKEDEIEGVNRMQMSIAVPYSECMPISNLYSYFPLLDVDSPFDCVMHATYRLGDQRNNLICDDVNRQVLRKHLEYLCDVAESIAVYDPATAQRMLLPKFYGDDVARIFPQAIARFGLDDEFVRKVAKLKIFQTVNDELVSLSDNPKCIGSDYPSFFKGEAFAGLLKRGVNDPKLTRLVSERIGIDTVFAANALCDAINAASSAWELQERVAAFVWWNDFAKSADVRVLPNLLELESGCWLGYKDECYLWEGDFESITLPEWVKVPALTKECQNELVSQIESHVVRRVLEDNRKESVIRTISDAAMVPVVTFKYRDRSSVLSVVNRSVDSYGRSIDFIKWLWQNHDEIEAPKDSLESRVKLKFPSSEKSYSTPDTLYFGNAYGNPLSSKLFFGEYHKFPDYSVFGVQDHEKDVFKGYISTFGVLEFPKIVTMDIADPIGWYDARMKEKIYAAGMFANTLSSCIDRCYYTIPYIKDLREILSKLSMNEVVKWILTDPDLRMCLNSTECPRDVGALVEFHGNAQRPDTVWPWRGPIENYILAAFNDTPWMEINGRRYAPIEVLNGYITKNSEKFDGFCPIFSESHAKEIASYMKFDDIADILEVMSMFDLPKHVTDLPSDSFYGLLLDLQKDGETNGGDYQQIRTIYRLVEQAGFNTVYEESDNKKRFFEEGKMLVMHQGELKYHPANESYLPSANIIDKKSVPIVQKSTRTQNESFVKVFGCCRYDKEFKIIEESAVVSSQNSAFQSYFIEFHKYARAYAERNDNIKRCISNLSVTIVKSIDVNQDSSVRTSNEPYTIFKVSESKWYIVVGDGAYEKNRLSECIENIFANIANTSGFDGSNIGELFRTSDSETRDFLIEKEFGSLNVLNEDNSINLIKDKFIDTLKALGYDEATVSQEIDFDDFTSDKNIECLIRFFNAMNIELEEFKNAGFCYPIRIHDYWKRQLQRLVEDNRMLFKDYLYNLALSDKQLQNSFLSGYEDFVNYFYNCDIPNSTTFVPFGELKWKFGDWTVCKCALSAEAEYAKNYDLLNPENRYANTISNDNSAKTMIYFNRKDEFDSWLQDQEESRMETVSETPRDIREKYLGSTKLTEYEIRYSYPKSSSASESINKKKSSSKVVTSEALAKEAEEKKRKGNIGELLVYGYLCDRYGLENVFPVSEAFSQLGIIKSGQDRSAGYDLSYKHEGQEYFVEVKTGESNRFFISPSELQFAKEHPDNYYVYHVFDTDPESPKFHIIQNFWNDPNYRRNDIVEKIEYTF